MHMTEANDRQAERNAKSVRWNKRKGWKGFVHGYSKWIKACEEEGRWDAVDWGKDGEKSGAKSMEKDEKHPNKTIYHY